MSRQQVVVVSDASSIINLEQVELAGANLTRWLFREFPVEMSSTVHAEVVRHSTDSSSYRKRRRDDDFGRLETLYLSGVPGVTLGVADDAGERHNCCLALEAIRRHRFGQCVFLIDDQRAIDKFIKTTMSDFLAGVCWNSLDLVLYLYFRHCTDHHNRITRTQAENALRDMVAVFGSQPSQLILPPVSPKLMSLLAGYKKKLDALHSRLAAFIR